MYCGIYLINTWICWLVIIKERESETEAGVEVFYLKIEGML